MIMITTIISDEDKQHEAGEAPTLRLAKPDRTQSHAAWLDAKVASHLVRPHVENVGHLRRKLCVVSDGDGKLVS